jgi:hypothetical protein
MAPSARNMSALPQVEDLQLLSSGETQAGTTGSQNSTCHQAPVHPVPRHRTRLKFEASFSIWRLIEIYGMGFTTFYSLNKSDAIFFNVHRISACPGTTVFTCPVSGPLYLGSGHQDTGGLSQVLSLLRMKQPFIWSAGP